MLHSLHVEKIFNSIFFGNKNDYKCQGENGSMINSKLKIEHFRKFFNGKMYSSISPSRANSKNVQSMSFKDDSGSEV